MSARLASGICKTCSRDKAVRLKVITMWGRKNIYQRSREYRNALPVSARVVLVERVKGHESAAYDVLRTAMHVPPVSPIQCIFRFQSPVRENVRGTGAF